jgi:hypothetical protein
MSRPKSLAWLVVLLIGCGGGTAADSGQKASKTSTSKAPSIAGVTAPFTVEEALAALGPSVGKTEEEGALKVDWEDTSWAGNSWKVTASFSTVEGDDSAALVLMAKRHEGAITGQAQELCQPILDAGGTRVVTWPKTPSRRYAEAWRKQVEAGDAGLGCVFQVDGVFSMALATGDALLAVTGHSKEEKDLFATSFFEQADWSSLKHVGDRIEAGGTAYVVQSVQPVRRGWRARDDSGSQLLRVNYTIENASKASATGIEHTLLLRDAQGRSFTPSKEATDDALNDAGLQPVSELHPGVPKKQVAVFELPASEKRLALVLPSVLGPPAEATINLDFTEREK